MKQVRILNVPAEHFIALRLRGRLADKHHLFDKLHVLPLEIGKRVIFISKVLLLLQNGIEIHLLVCLVASIEFEHALRKL